MQRPEARQGPQPQNQARRKDIDVLSLLGDKEKVLNETRLIRDRIIQARKDIQPGQPLAATFKERYDTVGKVLQAIETIANIEDNTPNIDIILKNTLNPLAEKYGFQIV